jgi:hypothetical protein
MFFCTLCFKNTIIYFLINCNTGVTLRDYGVADYGVGATFTRKKCALDVHVQVLLFLDGGVEFQMHSLMVILVRMMMLSMQTIMPLQSKRRLSSYGLGQYQMIVCIIEAGGCKPSSLT